MGCISTPGVMSVAPGTVSPMTDHDQPARRHWVNTVSLDHVRRGVEGGFTQADHGKDTRLRRLRPGDGLVFYSPRTAMHSGDPLQRFTAVGTVTGEEPYQVEISPDFRPWRLAVDFADVGQADARALVSHLSFIKDEARWGLPFRRGLFEIPEPDFALIARAMRGG
jgi:EVE domain